MTRTRFKCLGLLALAGVACAPAVALAQSSPDVRSYDPGFASAGVPMRGPNAVAPDVRRFDPTVASQGVPMRAPGGSTPRDDGSTASAGVAMRPPANSGAMASVQNGNRPSR